MAATTICRVGTLEPLSVQFVLLLRFGIAEGSKLGAGDSKARVDI